MRESKEWHARRSRGQEEYELLQHRPRRDRFPRGLFEQVRKEHLGGVPHNLRDVRRDERADLRHRRLDLRVDPETKNNATIAFIGTTDRGTPCTPLKKDNKPQAAA